MTEPYAYKAVMAFCRCADRSRHDGVCAWEPHYECNRCGVEVDAANPCPDHAPTEFAGLVLIDCQATPRHALMFAYDNEGFTPDCLFCCLARALDVDGLEAA